MQIAGRVAIFSIIGHQGASIARRFYLNTTSAPIGQKTDRSAKLSIDYTYLRV